MRIAGNAGGNAPDPNRILAQTISMIGETGVDPYAALGVLIEARSRMTDRSGFRLAAPGLEVSRAL